MNIIAVDDERPVLYMVEKAIREAVPDCSLSGFTSARRAIEYAETEKIDVAFLDINMADIDGMALAKQLKAICAKTNIIFITGYSEYAVDAFALPASGYIMKPAEPGAILRELGRLRDPVETESDSRVRIKCFGSFGVFVEGRPLLFPGKKPKELLAYLVHKQGSPVNNSEIAAVLWEDSIDNPSVASNVRNVISRLMKALKEAGVADIVQRSWNSTAVDARKFSCDYYDYLNNKVDSINAYTGEYMNQYSWAEFTTAYLNDIITKQDK